MSDKISGWYWMPHVPSDSGRGFIVFDERGNMVAAELTEEHARLIAAVPDLLAALDLILPMAKGYAAAHPVGSNRAYTEAAEDAIARAREFENE